MIITSLDKAVFDISKAKALIRTIEIAYGPFDEDTIEIADKENLSGCLYALFDIVDDVSKDIDGISEELISRNVSNS